MLIYHSAFSVKQIQPSEALFFSPKWKFPSVVYYTKTNLPQNLKSYPIVPTVTVDVLKDLFLPKPKPKDILSAGISGVQQNQNNSSSKIIKKLPSQSLSSLPLPYKPLQDDEIPGKGQIIAIDAEFVTLGQEETELRSDGKLSTVKPQQLSLGKKI